MPLSNEQLALMILDGAKEELSDEQLVFTTRWIETELAEGYNAGAEISTTCLTHALGCMGEVATAPDCEPYGLAMKSVYDAWTRTGQNKGSGNFKEYADGELNIAMTKWHEASVEGNVVDDWDAPHGLEEFTASVTNMSAPVAAKAVYEEVVGKIEADSPYTDTREKCILLIDKAREPLQRLIEKAERSQKPQQAIER